MQEENKIYGKIELVVSTVYQIIASMLTLLEYGRGDRS
jgi:hypothetical protein